MRKRSLPACLVLLVLSGCGSDEPERRILTDQWDTVGIIAPESADDTTLLLFVSQLTEWNGGYSVRDRGTKSIRYVSKDGELIWAFGQVGSGPGEVRSLEWAWPGPNGYLWSADWSGAKILGLDEQGQVVRERSLLHLPVIPSRFGFLGDRLIATTNLPDPFLMVLDTATLDPVKEIPFPLPDSLSVSWNFAANIATDENVLVVALVHGPGFLVLRSDQIQYHPYIDHIPWALKSGPRIRAMGADSARYGASSVEVEDGLIHMLFGGRPFRKAHPDEPTNLIDVYDIDGSYLHSYRLPGDFDKMTRSEGDYVLSNESELGFPQIFRLRPKGN